MQVILPMSSFLETDRIALREFTEADAAALFALDSDPEVMRYCGPFALANEATYRERIRTYFRPYYAKGPDFGFWAAEEKSTRAFVGWFHLRSALDYRFAKEAEYADGDFDIGYRLIRAAWNKGYATEVTKALIRRGFALPAVKAIVACALAANAASIRVMEKCGLKKVCAFPLPGFDVPAVKYAIRRNMKQQ